MKLSVSLPDDDVAFLDEVAARSGYPSRSAVLQRAVRLLRGLELGDDYAAAWQEWDLSGVAGDWDAAAADGLPAR
jgi:Arc/MetJ-type ribon-helix-helix transcriptional regulator